MKTFMITGASSGLGAAITAALVKEGHHVLAGVRTTSAVTTLREEHGAQVEPVLLDVTSEVAAAELAARTGPLAGLVNCAGASLAGPLEWTDTAQVRHLFEVNVIGVHTVTRALLPALKQARGRLVNVSSMSGLLVPPFLGAYAASKFALEAMSDAWRLELAPYGVHVSVIEPGALATPMWERLLIELQGPAGTAHPQWDRAKKRLIEAGRDAEPLDATVKDVLHALEADTPRTRYAADSVRSLSALSDEARDATLREMWGLDG